MFVTELGTFGLRGLVFGLRGSISIFCLFLIAGGGVQRGAASATGGGVRRGAASATFYYCILDTPRDVVLEFRICCGRCPFNQMLDT